MERKYRSTSINANRQRATDPSSAKETEAARNLVTTAVSMAALCKLKLESAALRRTPKEEAERVVGRRGEWAPGGGAAKKRVVPQNRSMISDGQAPLGALCCWSKDQRRAELGPSSCVGGEQADGPDGQEKRKLFNHRCAIVHCERHRHPQVDIFSGKPSKRWEEAPYLRRTWRR